MKINIDNYIEYFVNYYDQNLSQQEIAELFTFLDNNSELEKEFYEFLSVSPLSENNNESISFNKDSLIRSEKDNFDIQCIDYIENQMDNDEKQKFLFALNSDIKKHDTFNYFLATVQQADKNIFFPKRLIKPYQRAKFKQYSYVVAASIVVLISLTFAIKFFMPDNHLLQTNAFTALNKANKVKPITVKKVIRPKILSQDNVEAVKKEVNQHALKQRKPKKQPFSTIETIQKISAKPFIEKNLALVSPLDTRVIENPDKNYDNIQTKTQKTSNTKTLKDFAIGKVKEISKDHVEITQDKKNPKKIDKIIIKTKKFSFKKY